MQLPTHVENKLKQLEFERNLARQECAQAKDAMFIYMIVAIFGWGGFIVSIMFDLTRWL